MSAYAPVYRKVRFSEELALSLADRVEWGEPDEDGFYTPSLWHDFDRYDAVQREAVAQERARIRSAVEGLDETVTPGDMGWRPVPGSVSRAAVLRALDPEAEGGTP